jgi:hypothetical protein
MEPTVLKTQALRKAVESPARLKISNGQLVTVSGKPVVFDGFPEGMEVVVVPHAVAKKLLENNDLLYCLGW